MMYHNKNFFMNLTYGGTMNTIWRSKKIENEIINWRRELHKIPELNFESKTKYVQDENLNE